MCGGHTCKRCGGYVANSSSEHRRGCALPESTREAIMYSGLPVEAGEAAIAAAEDKALELWGQDYLRERRAEDARARVPRPNVSPLVTVPLAGQVFAVGADGLVQVPQSSAGVWAGPPWTVTLPAVVTTSA